MEPSYTVDVNRLVNDIKGFVAQLKTIYFENKEPIDDNEITLQKLCVKLETALRHGMKDKYSFLGVRKDYWNFFSECLPKDEGVRYVNSLSQLHTVQGKGRALIRYCLVQKTLADTIQRSLMHRRRTEWFSSEALLLSKALSGALISKLYDLNELEFHLSCTGCDLDMSWPAFASRMFTDGFQRRTRRNSAGSVASTTDFANERIDPLVALNTELSALKQMITREFDEEKSNDDGTGESNSSTDDAPLNIGEVTLEISRVHQFILKWRSTIDSKIYKAENEIERLAQEKDRAMSESDMKIAQLTEKHNNLSSLASKESALHVADLQNKLKTAEDAITQRNVDLDCLNKKLQEVSYNYEESQSAQVGMKQQLNDATEKQQCFDIQVRSLQEKLATEMQKGTAAEEENNFLKSQLKELQEAELSSQNKLQESETKLRIKTLEQEKLQEAFENVNGLVFSSFDDFESYYKAQLRNKEKGLEVKDSENKSLERRLNLSNEENENLKKELMVTQENLSLVQKKLEECLERNRVQDEQCARAKLEVKTFMEKFKIINNVLLQCRLFESHDVESIMMEIPEMIDGETVFEEQCQKLIDDFNETKTQVKALEEALKNASSEKVAVENGSKTLTLKIERLLKQTEEMKDETEQLCRDKEKEKKRRSELDDRVRVLEGDKLKLENELNGALEEKLNLESELQIVNDKLQEESCLRLLNQSEASEITEQLNNVMLEKKDALEELKILKEVIEKSKKEIDEKVTELVKCNNDLSSSKAAYQETTSVLETVREKMRLLTEEKNLCEEKIVDYEKQFSSLKCTFDQEVSSLKFQLSSEALEYDKQIKELSKEKQEALSLREKMQENEDIIGELENKLKERNEAWQSEKKKLTSDIKLLKHEVKVLNDNIDADKQEIQSMESTLSLSKKQYEKEKGRSKEYRKTIKEIKGQKSEKEKLLEHEKMELEEDIRLLKAKLVSLLSDKSELWKKSNQLEFDMKTRLSDKWVEDKDVAQCAQCNAEFSLFVRKHHCRFCGNVFCRACSDNFVKTIHSRKPYRSCNACFEKEKELRSDTSLTRNDSQGDQNDVTVSSTGSDSEADSSLGDSLTGPLKTSTTPTIETNGAKSEQDGQSVGLANVQSKQMQSDSCDDLDDNYEIIEESEGSLTDLLDDETLNVKSEVLTPNDVKDNAAWSEATIPPGMRYLISINVLAESKLAIEFTTSPQGVLFGAAVKEKGHPRGETKTLISLCEINSHKQSASKQLQIKRSGVAIFLFDNTHSKKTEKKLRFRIDVPS